MAGTRGPVPKRSDQRRRPNKPDMEISRRAGASTVPIPEASPDWHPIAARWYAALGESGQAVFFQPSDWAHAQFIAEAMSRLCFSERMSGQMFAAIDSASTKLMVTEGDRRRLRVELEAAQAVDEDAAAGVALMEEWREKLGG